MPDWDWIPDKSWQWYSKRLFPSSVSGRTMPGNRKGQFTAFLTMLIWIQIAMWHSFTQIHRKKKRYHNKASDEISETYGRVYFLPYVRTPSAELMWSNTFCHICVFLFLVSSQFLCNIECPRRRCSWPGDIGVVDFHCCCWLKIGAPIVRARGEGVGGQIRVPGKYISTILTPKIDFCTSSAIWSWNLIVISLFSHMDRCLLMQQVLH